MKLNLLKYRHHFISIIIMLLISTIYYSPQLKGLTTDSGDASAGIGQSKELKDYKEKTGDIGLWSGTLFSGMPAYQVALLKNTNMFKYINKLIKFGIPGPIGVFFSAMLIFYFSLVFFKINHWIALLAAFAFSFNTYNLMIYEAGHFRKVGAVVSMIPILISIIILFQKKYLNGFIFFTFSLALNLLYFHIQMSYYFAIFISIFIIFEFFEHLKNKNLKSYFKVISLLLLGTLLAASTSLGKTLPIKEYAKESMRGKPILKPSDNKNLSSSETEGLEWNYAMSWSNGLMDLVAIYIPGIVGGSSNQPIDKNTNTYKEFKKFGQKIKYAPLYWGAIGSASGPSYNGSIIIMLLIIGLFTLPNKYRFSFGIAILIAFSISLGKNFEIFNKTLYNYLPIYNKFRAHSSVMAITPLFTVMLAVLTLKNLISENNKTKLIKPLSYTIVFLSIVSLIFILFGSSLFNFEAVSDARYAGSQLDINVFIKDRISLMKADSFRSLIVVFIGGGLIFLYLKGRVKQNIFLILLFFISTVDIWGIDKRYFNSDDFVKLKTIKNKFIPTKADKQILKDKDPHYRVYNQTKNPFNENFTSYFHKSIGGYHPAKLQRYQDIIDHHLVKGNMKVFNMLNTKYFIVNSKDKKSVIAQKNHEALGNAWFVDSIKIVTTANEEIDALNIIDIKNEAVIHKEFESKISNLEKPNKASIKLDEYLPNKISYTSSNGKTSLAVFSEVWYPLGWKAYVDGIETEIIRANYVLRAMKIPAGNHKIVMTFDPQSLKYGQIVSLITSTLIIVLTLLFLIYKLYLIYFKKD